MAGEPQPEGFCFLYFLDFIVEPLLNHWLKYHQPRIWAHFVPKIELFQAADALRRRQEEI